MFDKTRRYVVAAMVLLLASAAPAPAQTPFFVSVSGTLYSNLVDFLTPVGTGTNRRTVIRVVTNAPVPGISFELRPAPAAAGKSRPTTVEFCPNASTVPACTIKINHFDETDQGSGVVTPVASALVAQAVPGADPCCGMYEITVQYDDGYTFPAAETWQLTVIATATAYEYFGFAGTTSTEVTKARMQLPSTIDFGEVQQGVTSQYAPVRSVDVRNIGTAPLTISTGSLPTAPDFSRVASGFQSVLPGAHLPSDWALGNGLWYSASPQALGDRMATFHVASSDGQDLVGNLHVHGVSLLAHFLIDISGSMKWTPAGCPTWPNPDCVPAETDSRLWLAKQSTKETNYWIQDFSTGQAYEGLSTFPGFTNGQNGQVIVPTDRAYNTTANIQVAFGTGASGGLQASGWTPMETGIITAHTDMSRIANAKDLRKTILLLTDGSENQGSNARNQMLSLSTDHIRVYTVGLGVPGSGEVDLAVLNDLAAGTGGQAFVSADASQPFDLKGAFKQVAIQWLGLTPVEDPEGLIRAGQSRSHDVCLDSSVEGVSFVVDWNRQVPDGIAVQLHTPKGETITPTTTGVAFHKDNTFSSYTIRGDRVRGGQAAGKWTIDLTGGSGLPSNDDTRYSYTVVVQSPIAATPAITPGYIFTGGAVKFEVHVSGVPAVNLPKTTAVLHYDTPGRSFNTFLASNAINPSWVKDSTGPVTTRTLRTGSNTRARSGADSVRAEILSPRARKAIALARFADKRFVDQRQRDSTVLYDDGTHGDRVARDGIFSAQLPVAAYEGVYTFTIVVNGPNPTPVPVPQGCLLRQIRFSSYVPIHLTAALLGRQMRLATIDSAQFFDLGAYKAVSGPTPAGLERKIVRLTPKDELGNYWGPGYARNVKFALTNAEAVGGVIDNWDGSYLQVIQYRMGVHPLVAVTAGGVTTSPVGLGGGLPLPWWVILLILILAAIIAVWLRTRRGTV